MRNPPAEFRHFGGEEYELFNGEYGPRGKGPHGAYDNAQANEQAKLWRTSAEGMTRKVKVAGEEWYFLYFR